MKKTKKFLIIFLSVLLLSACSRQRYISQNDFVSRFNQGSQSVKLGEDKYYEKDNEFCFFAGSDSLREVLISLKQNEKLYVVCAEMTVIKDSKALDDTQRDELLKTVSSMLSVICNCEEAEAAAELAKTDFNRDKFDFKDNTQSFEIMKAKCFFYSNGEMIFFRVEIK